MLYDFLSCLMRETYLALLILLYLSSEYKFWSPRNNLNANKSWHWKTANNNNNNNINNSSLIKVQAAPDFLISEQCSNHSCYINVLPWNKIRAHSSHPCCLWESTLGLQKCHDVCNGPWSSVHLFKIQSILSWRNWEYAVTNIINSATSLTQYWKAM
jgi:hypothetical protein